MRSLANRSPTPETTSANAIRAREKPHDEYIE
jgi:hypothetical protein